MSYFYGEWKVTIDGKARLTIPAVFRRETKDFFVAVSSDGKIRIYRKKGKVPFSRIYPVTADKQGRILIPYQLRKKLSDNVIFKAGENGEYLEQGGKKWRIGFALIAGKVMNSIRITPLIR
jgi:DNA-binding transcriptional regulator/RsmH inhibitor MraZ